MNYDNKVSLTPNWSDFSQLWKIISIALFLLLLLLWFLQASPWSKNGGVCANNTVSPVDSGGDVTTDNLPPDLMLKGDSVVHLPVGTSYTDVGATSIDKIDGEVSVVVTGEVDYNTPGEYILTYTAIDSAGNKSSKTRTVVIDAKQSDVKQPAPVSKIVRLPETVKLYFGNSSAALPENSSSAIEEVVMYLEHDLASTVVISGYHSASGSYEYNQNLSRQRAESVSQLLQNVGISVDRMILEKPIETTGSGSAAEARRVEVSIR